MSDERNDIVIVGKTASGSWHTEHAVLGQIDVLHSSAHLVSAQIVIQAAVIIEGENSLVVLDLDVYRKWLVAEVSQTAAQLLCDSISKISYN